MVHWIMSTGFPPKTLPEFASIGTNNGLKSRLDYLDIKNSRKCITRSHCQPVFGTIVSWALKQISEVSILSWEKTLLYRELYVFIHPEKSV